MKCFKSITISLFLIVILISTALAAPTYKDMPTSHWAYSAVSSIADKQLMVGDAAGNFRPDALMDKFETTKILAKAAGFKYTGLTDEEQTYYNKAYEKNKAFIAKYSSTYTKWNSTTDREIAFLLEQEILTAEDLNQFIVNDQDSNERLRALSKEEAAVFLVRLINKKTEALNSNSTFKFSDDSNINLAYKPYIYYLKELNIITGDQNNNYNPRSAVTRAMFAVMLDKSLKYYDKNQMQPVVTKPTTESVIKLETIAGTVDTIFPQLSGIQIISPNGEKNIYKVASMVTVYIDNFLKTTEDLKPGMSVIGIVIDNQITDLKAQTVQEPKEPVEPITVEGYVTNTSKTDKGRTITIELRNLTTRGEIISQNRTFNLKPDAEIKRGDKEVSFDTISSKDAVVATVVSEDAVSLLLEDKELAIENGIIVSKHLNADIPNVVVKTESGKEYELLLTSNSVITRFGVLINKFTELRIGDSVNVTTSYNEIKTLYAHGSISNVEGIVEEIFISKERCFIKISMQNNISKVFDIYNTQLKEVYDLRIGKKVSLRLQSQEVETIKIYND